MPFTPDNAKVNHYPGTTKQACEDGFERLEMPEMPKTNNMGRLAGIEFQCDDDSMDGND